MKTAEAFLKKFDSKPKGKLVRMHHAVYDVPEELIPTLELVKKDAFGAGLYLGDEREEFKPSPGILELIKESKKSVKVNHEAAWLFICGRDAFTKNIIGECPEGPVVVKNETGEALGIGELKGKILTNIMDVGSFLRREKNSS